MNELINKFVEALVVFSTDLLMPFMVLLWGGAMAFRLLVHYTVSREDWFAREFEKRVVMFLEEDHRQDKFSFFVMTKRLLEKTYYELFEMRGIMKRRRLDHIADPADRLFLVQHGCAFVVRDTLKQIKFLKFERSSGRFTETSKTVYQNNPCFNKVFGIIPLETCNAILGILPGLFVVGGIFGTFLGIMQALPRLAGMDLSDPAGAKVILDAFLINISFSMATSIVGMIFSVSLQVLNTTFSAEKLFVDIVDRYDNTLASLWHRCDNNALPEEISRFDEHRDPIEALAELSVHKEIESGGPGYYKKVKSFMPEEDQRSYRLPPAPGSRLAEKNPNELPPPGDGNKKDAA